HARRRLTERFRVRAELLEIVDEELFERDPASILESFLMMMQPPGLRGMTAPTLRALWRARRCIDATFRRDPRARLLFVHLLQQPRGIVHEFRRMNQYGILGRYLPEFGSIVGQMQHDLFHVYTVDQHILMVIRNLRRFTMPELAHEFPVGSERRLVALYLLTVADVRGTSPKVWNAWKAKLLEDLFRATRRVLTGEPLARDAALAEKQAEAARLLRLYALSDNVKDRLWAQ